MQDILHHILSLLPLRDAARAACSSNTFLRSWRCHPILTLNRHIVASNANAPQESFSYRIDNILRKHSDIGIKIFMLELYGIFYSCHYLDRWLQNSIQCLELSLCAFHPTSELGPLRKLTSLCLCCVRISGDELEYFLSNSPALKQLNHSECQEIMCLR
jgi:hypothetical protein